MQCQKFEEEQQKKVKPRKKYRRYTIQMRLKLIDLVINQHMSTTKAGALLKIKQTSANRIMKSYLQKNKIFEKKSDKLRREAEQAQKESQKLREQRSSNLSQVTCREKQLHFRPAQQISQAGNGPLSLAPPKIEEPEMLEANNSNYIQNYHPNAIGGRGWPQVVIYNNSQVFTYLMPPFCYMPANCFQFSP